MIKRYKVITGSLNIRHTPREHSDSVGKELKLGDEVTTQLDTQEDKNYIWIKHEQGWSAISDRGKTYFLMVEIPQPDADNLIRFVVKNAVSIRKEAGLNQSHKGQLQVGETITVSPTSFKMVDNHIWWQHSKGWSAERTVNGHIVYLKHTKTDADAPATISAIPVTKQPDPNPSVDQTTTDPITKQPDPNHTVQETTDTKSTTANAISVLKVFEVIAQNGVNVRNDHNLNGTWIKNIPTGSHIKSDGNYVKDGGYWWIKHGDNWSATGSLSNRNEYLKELQDITPSIPQDKQPTSAPTPPEPSSAPNMPTRDDEPVQNPQKAKKMRVISSSPARVRTEPKTGNETFRHYLYTGQIIECTEEKIEGNHIWGKHRDGWSAIRSKNGKSIFLEEVTASNADKATYLSGYRSLFQQFPVNFNLTTSFQYYGNNMFAMRYKNDYGYDNYSQGLHGGLDFINQKQNLDVFPVCDSTFVEEFGTGNNKAVVLKAGGYEIVYQHLTNIKSFKENEFISKETKIAETDAYGAQHLHLEVRLSKTYILNPLLFFKQPLYDKIISKFNPNKENIRYKNDFPESTRNFFYRVDETSKWSKPLDQPTLHIGSKVILRPQRYAKDNS